MVAACVDGARSPTPRPNSKAWSVIAIHVAVSSSLMKPAQVASPLSTIGAA